MSAINDILANVDVNQLAGMLGADPQDVQSAAGTAVGSLLSGAEQSAGQPQDAVAFANALGQHMGSPADPSTPTDLNAVDFNDGAKIVNHLLPAGEQRQLFGGAQGQLVQKLLPLLAPIVMAYLAKRLQSGMTRGGGLDSGLGSVLGSVLGGGSAYGQQSYPQGGGLGGGMGDILGQILGGSHAGSPTTTTPGRVPSGGGLGDVLGQILGGGQAADTTSTMGSAQTFPTTTNTGGLSMPDEGVGTTYGSQAGYGAQPQSGGMVGNVLKNILFGR